MKNEELNINDFLNSFLNKHYDRGNLLFENIGVFYEMSQFVGRQTSIEIPKETGDWSKMSKSTFLQNIELINDFFQKLGIEFAMNKILSDGTVDIITTEDDIVKRGRNNYLGEHKSIKIYNNGYVADTIIWIHEISHYRNQPDDRRGQVNDLLTEALAHTTSLIYADYLEAKGFVRETNFARYNHIHIFNCVSYDCYIVSKVFKLYEALGDTSKDSYRYLYKTDEDYEEVIKEFKRIITAGSIKVHDILWYTVSGFLSIYMYEEYHKDNSFISKIEELNASLLNGDSLKKCLNIIGITGYNEESLRKIEESYKEFKKNLMTPSTKILKK